MKRELSWARAAVVSATLLLPMLTAGSTANAKQLAYATAAQTESLPAYAVTLQTQIPQVMKANAIPGMIVLIKSAKQGDWSATFGTAEIDQMVPMSMDDYFRIGSNTKTMTSTVILQLVQEGKLRLDDPIAKYRPDVPNGQNITIAQLSEMRSGLFNFSLDQEFNETLDADPQKAWTPNELLAIGFAHPPDFAPGEQFEYSNTNIILLGVVIEQLTGMSVSDAFQKRIFEPLGLTHTYLPKNTDASLPDPHAQGYQFGTNAETIESSRLPPAQLAAALNGTLKPINYTDANPSWGWTAGAAISIPDEMATYAKALIVGGLLDAKTQQLRLQSIQPIDPSQPNGPGYGLGLIEFAPHVYGHDGGLPGYSTLMVYDPIEDITIIIGTNLYQSPVDSNNAAAEMGRLIIRTLYGVPVPGVDPAAVSSASAQPAPPPAQVPAGS
jgi:D-alanyl-D-alanine carboxypeptidase